MTQQLTGHSHIIAVDTETTTSNKGNPYDSNNKLVCYSYANNIGDSGAQLVTKCSIAYLQSWLATFSLVVGFNFKFDLAWLKKYGVSFKGKEIWDVQLAEFILENQTKTLPSLNDTCNKYGIPTKEDVVKTQYWEKGIDTPDIPWEILSSYAEHDAVITLACYHAQIKLMSPAQIKLCKLMCYDMQILQEMEETGILFDEDLCKTKSKEVDDQIRTLKAELCAIYPNTPINFGSNDHLSAFLYGGIVKEEAKEHCGFYKTGKQAGQPKFKNIIIEHQLPRLYQPIKGTEMLKENIFSTNEDTLLKLKGKKGVIEKILELSKLEKLNGTYYNGLVALRERMNWEPNVLHGTFNQTIAKTGRLSSSKPNLQNFASELQNIFISRYND